MNNNEREQVIDELAKTLAFLDSTADMVVGAAKKIGGQMEKELMGLTFGTEPNKTVQVNVELTRRALKQVRDTDRLVTLNPLESVGFILLGHLKTIYASKALHAMIHGED